MFNIEQITRTDSTDPLFEGWAIANQVYRGGAQIPYRPSSLQLHFQPSSGMSIVMVDGTGGYAISARK